MQALVAIALKSVMISGLTLLLLQAMKRRSAAERSWIAHIGLLALVVMAIAPVVLPRWSVETPAALAARPAIEASGPSTTAPTAPIDRPATVSSAQPQSAQPVASKPALPQISAAAATQAIYAIPAFLLLLITALALARLIALRARADVLVDGHWLSALARAQRRMGFKHGTALLTSNELASPISWGLMRPVILLNNRAVAAADEAEAIIAHELAHVARMDWVKLLLARIATALFWFNPLVWMLAREAHQLREETADDAVLAADIADTDYAQLLVGVARHECPGLLLGAHGVAPSKSSLARRVARVLDGKSVRGPVARSFATGVFVGALLVTAPLAALTFTPRTTGGTKLVGRSPATAAGAADTALQAAVGPSDLPQIIASGVSASVTGAIAAINPGSGDFETVAPSGASVKSVNGMVISRAPSGASVTVYPPDQYGRRKVVAKAATGATAIYYADADDEIPGLRTRSGRRAHSALDDAIELKALNVTPEYINALRAAAPRLRNLEPREFGELKAVGVTPQYVQELARAGYGNLDKDDLTEARALGLQPEYIRAIGAAGFPNLSLETLTELRALGVTPGDIQRARGASAGRITIDQITDMKAVGLLSNPPRPPQPPQPPEPPDSDND